MQAYDPLPPQWWPLVIGEMPMPLSCIPAFLPRCHYVTRSESGAPIADAIDLPAMVVGAMRRKSFHLVKRSARAINADAQRSCADLCAILCGPGSRRSEDENLG
jgi:hypothetical protein